MAKEELKKNPIQSKANANVRQGFLSSVYFMEGEYFWFYKCAKTLFVDRHFAKLQKSTITSLWATGEETNKTFWD